MNELNDIKKTIAGKYLGKDGIHGVGISRAGNAIKIYFDVQHTEQQNAVLKQIKNEVSPFEVVEVAAQKPMAS